MKRADALPRLAEVARLFLKLGTIGFGGLVVQLAMMEEEAVKRRKWLSRAEFLDTVGATNLVPGPNTVKVALHLGYLRAGWLGFLVAGLGFILPSVAITGMIAWVYVQFGTVPQVALLLYGIKPAVLAVILTAVWKLARTAVKTWRLAAIGALMVLAVAVGINEAVAIVLGGVLGMFWLQGWKQVALLRTRPNPLFLAWPMHMAPMSKLYGGIAGVIGGGLIVATTPSLWDLGWFFLRIGSVLLGNGYVLVAFLGDLVREYHWLTQQQLLDAIAIGQFTPGPLLSTATFIGYLILGVPGAVIATIGIFLPSFVFVAMLNPLVSRLRRSPWSAAFLDAVNVSAVALLAVVAVQLARATLTTWPAWVIAALATAVGLRWKVSASWLVLGGAVGGWILGMVGGGILLR